MQCSSRENSNGHGEHNRRPDAHWNRRNHNDPSDREPARPHTDPPHSLRNDSEASSVIPFSLIHQPLDFGLCEAMHELARRCRRRLGMFGIAGRLVDVDLEPPGCQPGAQPRARVWSVRRECRTGRGLSTAPGQPPSRRTRCSRTAVSSRRLRAPVWRHRITSSWDG